MRFRGVAGGRRRLPPSSQHRPWLDGGRARHRGRTALAVRGLIAGLALGLSAAAPAADAQPAKPVRIGTLSNFPARQFEGFREGMRALGHIEGQTYTLERRFTGGKSERYPELVADLVRSRVDLILTLTPGARAAREIAPLIPVIFMSSGDPVADGLVASFSRPGGNLTGFALPWEDLASKWPELLRDTFPRIRRVAFLFNPGTSQLAPFKAAAASLKLDVVLLPARGDLDAAFAEAARQRAEAIVQNASPLFDSQVGRMVALAAKYRLPAVYHDRVWADAGGLMSYGPDLRFVFRRAAVYADRILKGTRPADLPVERPAKIEFVVNLKTAKALGLTIPQSVLLRADELIQ